LQVPIADGDTSTNVDAVGEPQEDGSVTGSGDGMLPEAEARHNKPPPEDAAGADAHFEQVAGNGQVADPSGSLVGSIPGSVEASATLSVRNPVPAVALPAQVPYVSGVHAPMAQCQESGANCRIRRSFTRSHESRIRVWDIRQQRMGECCPHRSQQRFGPPSHPAPP